jgi:hypothetical protein
LAKAQICLQKSEEEKSSLATLTNARLKQVLGRLQEFSLLQEAVLPVMTMPFTRGVQPVGIALS